MADSDNNPETLISVPNDFEAAMIVSTLAAHDVDATTSGEYTSGFRAEAPGDVKVLVRRCDLPVAQRVLGSLAIQHSPRSNDATGVTGSIAANSRSTRAILYMLLGSGLIFYLFYRFAG